MKARLSIFCRMLTATAQQVIVIVTN